MRERTFSRNAHVKKETKMDVTINDMIKFAEKVRLSPIGMASLTLAQNFFDEKSENKTTTPFTGLVAHAVAKMKAGLLVSHQDRIVSTYHTFDNPQVSTAYLAICAEWRSKKYGISLEDARKQEIQMAMDYALRYGDPEIMNWLLTDQMVLSQ